MKKTNKMSRYLILIAALASVIMLCFYPWISTEAEVSVDNHIDTSFKNTLLTQTFRNSQAAYFTLKQTQNQELKPYELFLDNAKEDFNTSYAQQIASIIYDQKQSFEQTFPDLDYYIYDKDSKSVLSNAKQQDTLQKLSTGNTKDSPYYWYIAFDYDDQGVLQIKCYSDSEEYSQAQLIERYQAAIRNLYATNTIQYHMPGESISSSVSYDENSGYVVQENNGDLTTFRISFSKTNDVYSLKPIKNTTFVYALDETSYQSLLAVEGEEPYYNNYSYQTATIPFIFLFSFGAFLLIVLKKANEDEETPIGYRLLTKIPVEVHTFLYLWYFMLMIVCSSGIVYNTIHGYHSFFTEQPASSFLGTCVIWLVDGFLFWFLFFLYTAYLSYMIKQFTIHHTWKRHTLCLRVYYGIKSFFVNGIANIKQIDLSKNDERRIFTALFINFIILSIFMFFWGFGIFFLFIYSILLFFFFTKYICSIRKDYESLLNVTKRMAEGDLECDIETELGIFHEFKNSMQDIRIGFKAAVAEEVQSQRMKTELITNVSHDLKTPLTSIISYVDLLKKEDLSEEERKKYLETLDRNSIRLKHLIEDLFEVSKANSGNLTLERVPVDLCALMKQVQIELQEPFKKQKLTIKNSFSDEKIVLSLDPQKTYRIFENLVSNIGKYALKNTRVYINITDYDRYVDITLKNISSTELNFDADEITERFTRGDASRNTEGSGLGLAIAKSLTELHGGKMKVQIDGDLFKVNLRLSKTETKKDFD